MQTDYPGRARHLLRWAGGRPYARFQHRRTPKIDRLKDTAMNDTDLVQHISALVEEEHRLREDTEAAGGHAERIRQLEVQLDQCWDLLRQRRAKREFGQNPDEAQPRDADTVESYLN
jgi:hypothetical protein